MPTVEISQMKIASLIVLGLHSWLAISFYVWRLLLKLPKLVEVAASSLKAATSDRAFVTYSVLVQIAYTNSIAGTAFVTYYMVLKMFLQLLSKVLTSSKVANTCFSFSFR